MELQVNQELLEFQVSLAIILQFRCIQAEIVTSVHMELQERLESKAQRVHLVPKDLPVLPEALAHTLALLVPRDHLGLADPLAQMENPDPVETKEGMHQLEPKAILDLQEVTENPVHLVHLRDLDLQDTPVLAVPLAHLVLERQPELLVPKVLLVLLVAEVVLDPMPNIVPAHDARKPKPLKENWRIDVPSDFTTYSIVQSVVPVLLFLSISDHFHGKNKA